MCVCVCVCVCVRGCVCACVCVAIDSLSGLEVVASDGSVQAHTHHQDLVARGEADVSSRS